MARESSSSIRRPVRAGSGPSFTTSRCAVTVIVVLFAKLARAPYSIHRPNATIRPAKTGNEGPRSATNTPPNHPKSARPVMGSMATKSRPTASSRRHLRASVSVPVTPSIPLGSALGAVASSKRLSIEAGCGNIAMRSSASGALGVSTLRIASHAVHSPTIVSASTSREGIPTPQVGQLTSIGGTVA